MRGHRLEQRFQQIATDRRTALGHQSADAVSPFTCPIGECAGEIIKTSTGMRVDHAIGLRFLVQVEQDAGENCVLEYIREVAGMEDMAIVHAVL